MKKTGNFKNSPLDHTEALDTWKIFFKEHDLSGAQINSYLNYIQNLNSSYLPIIFEIKHLSRLLGINIKELLVFINHSESSYRSFKIPKKSGGFREILSPYPILAHCQKWILNNILNTVTINQHCFSFQESKNIKDNAIIHLNKPELLKIDIENFFGNIKINRVIALFKRLGYTNSLSIYLASLCCYKNILPQGASTSPMLSNIIGGVLDIRLSLLAKKFNLFYSRYADDLTFSGTKIPKSFTTYVYNIIQSEGFSPNIKKTMLSRQGQQKIVTGLCITGKKLRIPKSYRRQFRQEIYYVLKNGISEFDGTIKTFDPLYLDRMIGKAQYILNIEPDNTVALEALPLLKQLKSNL